MRAWAFIEETLLALAIVHGGSENIIYQTLKSIAFGVIVLATTFFQQWIPGVRQLLWDPKPLAGQLMKQQYQLPWSHCGAAAFSAIQPWTMPPVLMDSGYADLPSFLWSIIADCRLL